MTDEFRTSIRVAATPDQVFPYLVEPDRLIRWMGTDAIVDPRTGGRYDLVVNGLGLSGHVEVYDPPKRLVVTWGYVDSPDLPPGASTVEIVLTLDGDDTIVELTTAVSTAARRATTAPAGSTGSNVSASPRPAATPDPTPHPTAPATTRTADSFRRLGCPPPRCDVSHTPGRRDTPRPETGRGSMTEYLQVWRAPVAEGNVERLLLVAAETLLLLGTATTTARPLMAAAARTCRGIGKVDSSGSSSPDDAAAVGTLTREPPSGSGCEPLVAPPHGVVDDPSDADAERDVGLCLVGAGGLGLGVTSGEDSA